MFTPTMPLRSTRKTSCQTRTISKTSLTYCVKHSRQMELTVSMRQQMQMSWLRRRETVTYVIGEDTDLLVLLCHYAERRMNDLYLKSSKEGGKCWHIDSVAEALGESICHVLPVVHALCGCDKTSRLYGIGKGAALRKVREDKGFLKCIEAFCCQSGSQEAIWSAGEKALVYLYWGKGNDTSDRRRKTKFCNKVAKSSTTVNEVYLLNSPDNCHGRQLFAVACRNLLVSLTLV